MPASTLLPLWVVGAGLVIACLERIPALRFRCSPFLRPGFATDLVWQTLTLGTPILFRPWLVALAPLPLVGFWSEVSLAWSAAAALILYDLFAWLAHVLLHRFDPLWAVHKVHHSSRVLDWLATTRQHVVEGLLRNLPAQAVLFLLGLPLEAIAIALGIYVVFALVGHSNLRIGLRSIELLFVTPRVHRLHHVPATSGCNFGTVFTLWDRLLGSLVRRDIDADEAIGVPGEVETYPQSFWRALVEPLR